MPRLALALVGLVIGAAGVGPVLPPAVPLSLAESVSGASGAREDGVVQHGAEPNAGEVRAASPSGNGPSASAGQRVTTLHDRRILGLPVTAAIVIAGIVVVLALIVAGLIPGARRRPRARGNGRTAGVRRGR